MDKQKIDVMRARLEAAPMTDGNERWLRKSLERARVEYANAPESARDAMAGIEFELNARNDVRALLDEIERLLAIEKAARQFQVDYHTSHETEVFHELCEALGGHALPPCTGIAASWCPVHGTCTCARNESGERPLEEPGCPLHSPDSRHAEPAIEPTIDSILLSDAEREAAFARALELIRVWGEDPDEVIRKAAENVKAWRSAGRSDVTDAGASSTKR